MTQVVIQQPLTAQLGNIVETVDLVDEQGKCLGRFVPASPYADYGCPYTAEELQQMRSQRGGRPLAEIWKSLGVK